MSVLVIRADGGREIGAGHVMRSLALAQEWRVQGGEAVFVSAILDEGLARRLEREGFATESVQAEPGTMGDASATRAAAQQLKAEWLALDGYRFDSEYQRAVSADAFRTLMMDDTGDLGPYRADVILNQNLHAAEEMYRDAPGAQLLLGSQFILLRDEFVRRDLASHPVPDSARKLLVTLGGSDPDGHTLGVLAAVRELSDPELRCVAVVGASSPHLEAVTAAAAPDQRVEVRSGVEDMSPLMEWADLAVSSGGSTVWELAYMGVPTIVGSMVPVEERLAVGLIEHGLFAYVGGFAQIKPVALAGAINELASDPAAREAMGLRAREVVDGGGRERVVSAMNQLAKKRALPSQKVSE